jgi:hypothetical protein
LGLFLFLINRFFVKRASGIIELDKCDKLISISSLKARISPKQEKLFKVMGPSLAPGLTYVYVG